MEEKPIRVTKGVKWAKSDCYLSFFPFLLLADVLLDLLLTCIMMIS